MYKQYIYIYIYIYIYMPCAKNQRPAPRVNKLVCSRTIERNLVFASNYKR